MVKKKRRTLKHLLKKNVKKGDRISFVARQRTRLHLHTDRKVDIRVDTPR